MIGWKKVRRFSRILPVFANESTLARQRFMSKRLLDQQTSLLHYLTSGRAIFGSSGLPIDPALQALDRHRLGLEARFSHEKRMQKIIAVLPRTFALLGSAALLREFVDACPPREIG